MSGAIAHRRRTRVRRLFGLFIAAAGVFSSAAFAHGGETHDSDDVVAVLSDQSELPVGVHIQLRHTLAPQLLVENTTAKPLIILDDSGRAFLRIGPDDVEADLGTAAFHRTNTLMAPGAIAADASETPNWRAVADTPAWGWFDLRLRDGTTAVSHDVKNAGQIATVGSWRIPVNFGDTAKEITGTFEYRPPVAGMLEARVIDTGNLAAKAVVKAMTGSARPGLFVSYRGNEPLVIYDDNGMALFRFTDQHVAVNRAAPTWRLIRPSGAPTAVPTDAESADPVWARVSDTPSYGWIEPRLAAEAPSKPETGVTKLKSWQIKYRLGEASGRIEGVSEWATIKPAQAG